MVGSLKYLSTNKWDLNKFKKVFKSKKRSQCAPPAPAHGLYLKKLFIIKDKFIYSHIFL